MKLFIKIIRKTALFLFFLNLVVIFFACSLGKNNDWVVFRGEEGKGYSSGKIYPPIGIKWQLKLQEGKAQERHFNPPVVYKNTLYFGSSDSNFYALDIISGFMRWVYHARAPINSVPYVDNEKVYFGSTDGFIYAVYHKTGDIAWEYFSGYPVNSTIVGYKNILVVTTDTGNTHFFTKDGKEIFSVPNNTWQNNSFQVKNDIVYFMPGPPENTNALGAYSIPEKKYLWLLNTSDDGLYWYSFPALLGKNIYFAACGIIEGGFLFEYFALDALTGKGIWRNTEVTDFFDLGGYDAIELLLENIYILDYMSPAIWKDIVIFTPGDNSIKAFKATSGEKIWETRFSAPASSAPSISASRVYFGTRKNEYENIPSFIKCLDAASGKQLWEIETEGDVLGSPVIAGKWIIFGTDENYLYVLESLF
jgi:outer membrane protein assembly factor BamB